MLGRAQVIRDALAKYMVDYQQRPEAKTERRWIDRLVPDGGIGGGMVYCLQWQDRSTITLFENGGASSSLPMTKALAHEPDVLPPGTGSKPPEISALTPELRALTPELNALTPDPRVRQLSA